MQAATQDLSEPSGRPSLAVDVVMRREPVIGPMSRWQTHRWVLADVLPTAAPQGLPVGAAPARPGAPREVEPLPGAQAVDGASYWLFPGHRIELFRDDVEGLFLNLSSPSPCFWVFWRADDEQLLGGEPMAVPQIVTLSYHDAGRWLDAQEKVDQVPAPEAVVEWLRAFVDQHHRAEPKRRKRPDSFKTLTDRFGQPARVSTDKALRGGGPGPREGGGA